MKKLLATLIVGTAFVPAWGYEEDVHFSLTYALCRLGTMSAADALRVASADQGMDDNETTKAKHVATFSASGGEAYKRKVWHALNDNRDKVLAQREVLWERAVGTKSLVCFGQYLHYFEDSFSHREVKGRDWQPFGWRLGHGLYGHQPDRVPYDEPLAKEMAFAVAQQVVAFVKATSQATPADPDSKATDTLVVALTKCVFKDSIGYWNHARMERVPKALDDALASISPKAPTGDDWAVPDLSQILGLKFDKDGNEIGQPPFSIAPTKGS